MTPRSYHHGNLRAALVDAAVGLAQEHGPDGVVLREVARRTGVTHNASYRHFAAREELLAEVAAVAMDRLAAAIRARTDALPAVPDGGDARVRARARLREVGRAYVEFAVAETGLFHVAFSAPMPEEHAAESPYDLLNQALDELVATGAVAPEVRAGAEVTCWAAVHGLSELLTSGPLRDLPPTDREAVLEGMLRTVEAGLARPA